LPCRSDKCCGAESMWPTDVCSSQPGEKTSCPESGSAAAREIYVQEVTQVERGSHRSSSFLDVTHCLGALNAFEDRVVLVYKEGQAAFKIHHPS